MNKSELVDKIARELNITKTMAGKALDVITMTVTQALKDGDQVVLPGFGSFKTGFRSAYEGRNPQDGKKIQIAAARVAKFRVGNKLKAAVRGD